jgi:hypothetical protein
MGLFIKSPDGAQQVELTQEQINVIVPLLNQRIPRKKMNQACLDALEAAGVPAKFESVSGSSEAQSKEGGAK